MSGNAVKRNQNPPKGHSRPGQTKINDHKSSIKTTLKNHE